MENIATMLSSVPSRIAVIADAHFHDLRGDYGFPGTGAGTACMTLRPLADTARSTRVFNESYHAFRHALDDVAKRGIAHVVLLGDYSDDGQHVTLDGVKKLLDEYAGRFGMRFYATVGNHDIFGAAGRHRSKRFLTGDGRYGLVTSNPDMRDPDACSVTVTDRMFCDGYPDGLSRMADFGFFPRPGDLHWETPFGSDGDARARMYDVHSPDGRSTRRLMDASYLVEPFAGVWLLMIDANVFVPVDGVAPFAAGDLADSTGAGWNAMLRHKAFILDWVRDVSERARVSGKSLLAFSHYPALDPLDGTAADERAILGQTGMSERIPEVDVATTLIEAGICIHFSGHLHVNDTARHRTENGFLINVAVPSLVAFPPGYKTIGLDGGRLSIETVDIGDMGLDPDIRRLYQIEVAATGLKADSLIAAGTYGDFLFEHLGHLVARRHLRREWPAELAALVHGLTLDDLVILSGIEEPVQVRDALARVRAAGNEAPVRSKRLSDLTALDFLRDWYRFRMASDMATGWVPQARCEAYAAVGAFFSDGKWRDPGCAQAVFARLFRMFVRYTTGLPSKDFTIDMQSGEILAKTLSCYSS